MPTATDSDSDVIGMLNDLIELEYTSIQAYEGAIERLDRSEHQRQIAEFKENRERHTRELDHLVRELHGKPVNGALISNVVTPWKIALTDLLGDKAVLNAMKRYEEDTTKAYERAVKRRNLPQPAVQVIQNALADERRHRDWLEKAIAAS